MNLPPSRIREHVRGWTESARDDRETLQTLGAAGRPRIIAFHAQQAVEKLLKGLLVSYGVDPLDAAIAARLQALESESR